MNKLSSQTGITTYKTILFSLALLASAGAGAWGRGLVEKDATSMSSLFTEVRQSTTHGSSLTNPLLECQELPEPISIGERVELQNNVAQILADYKRRGDLTEGAVYFRELIGGPWFGINEDKKFSPASLLKLPLAISFFWQAEENPDILAKQIQYEKGTENYDANQPYGPSHALESENIYSVMELIDLMLRESSNEAALVLVQLAEPGQLESVYSDFGFEPPAQGKDYFIDTHTFASFFRILFNATYLDRKDSEKLLTTLTQTEFHEGLVAGVPSDVVVAHKFGTRDIAGQANSKQLHDCGIVYAKTPYILCVMTQGNDFAHLAEFIKEVSALVYKNVAS